MIHIDPKILERINTWLTPTFDKETQDKIKDSIAFHPKEIQEGFYKDLEFGTGGMRGVMGVGTNRINKYTLGRNTQGLSNYLHEQFPNETPKVVIAYDCRHNSKSLAKVVADVFSANDIQVYLFEDLRTTPELSFAVRHLNCHCGIVLTASHNPPEYNGFKVYWQDGGQLVPPQDAAIIDEINSLDYSEIKFEAKDNFIKIIGKEVDDAFIDASIKHGNFTDQKAKDDITLVFTSLHGTSITAIPEVLERAGYHNVTIIEEQAKPDGDFPTVKSPNPEEPEALSMAIKKAEEIGADMVVGTDPDSDRLGIAVRNLEDDMQIVNGNQAMIMMTKFLLEKQKEKGFEGNEFVATTIVSTPMMQVMAKAYGVECKTALTGFKWIGKMIKDFPESQFLGGGEESFGYMVGDFVRDKDAVTSTLLACEIATDAKANGSSFYKRLIDCYVDYGYYKEHLVSLTKKGISGAEEIKQMLRDFKENPVDSVAGSKVKWIEDYNTSIAKNVITGEEKKIDIPKSNVLIYETEDGTRIAARPSGTEPKVKFYISTNAKLDKAENFKQVGKELDAKIERILSELKLG